MDTASTKLLFSPEMCPTFKNILFTTDFSPCSQLALPYARAIARRYGSTVHILHVVNSDLGMDAGESYRPVFRLIEEEGALAQQELDSLIQSGALKDVPNTTVVEIGSLWEVVAETIAERKIDLLVLGTRGRSGVGLLVLGSVAEEIFRRADCPVLTIGPKVHKGFSEGKLETVVYATDLSAASRSALPHALCFASANQSKLAVVHAVQPVVSSEGFVIMQADDLARSAKLDLTNLLPEIPEVRREIITRTGPAAEVILEIAKETSAGLIVMGAKRGTSTHRPWATAHQVVRQAECPVLTVRSSAER
jgi:nucleotide-binding universal stress UspA family protein